MEHNENREAYLAIFRTWVTRLIPRLVWKTGWTIERGYSEMSLSWFCMTMVCACARNKICFSMKIGWFLPLSCLPSTTGSTSIWGGLGYHNNIELHQHSSYSTDTMPKSPEHAPLLSGDMLCPPMQCMHVPEQLSRPSIRVISQEFLESWIATRAFPEYCMGMHIFATLTRPENTADAISEVLNSKIFLGGHAPRPPKRACFRTLTFACCAALYMCPTCARATILFWLRHCPHVLSVCSHACCLALTVVPNSVSAIGEWTHQCHVSNCIIM